MSGATVPDMLYQERLLRFLEDPGSYPHAPSSVQVVHTHLSFVALAGRLVYKVPKAVDLGFVDYSTLVKREACTRREVELNRRLCPDLYLGIVPIVDEGGRLAFADNGGAQRGPEHFGEVVDYAIKMRRLDDDGFLNRMLAESRVGTGEIDRIVDVLAAFYRRQPRDEQVSRYGHPHHIRDVVSDNLRSCRQYAGRLIPLPTYLALSHFCERYCSARRDLFAKRVHEGWIKDGHGDLQPEHIHFGPEGVSIYDCVAFNDALRCVDVAADIAFLAMELDFAEREALSRHLVDRMAAALSDGDLGRLMDFYMCYRAAVRVKVAILRGEAPDLSEEQRDHQRAQVPIYARLALRYAVSGLSPRVIAVMGRTGTGKTACAVRLGEALGWPAYSSDRARKALAGLPMTQRPSPEQRQKLYSPEMTAATYARLIDAARTKVEAGQGVILDATFSDARQRADLLRAMQQSGVPCCFIELTAPDHVIRSRLRSRETTGDVMSDARIEDFERLAAAYEAPQELDPQHRGHVNGDQEIEQVLADVYRGVIDCRLHR